MEGVKRLRGAVWVLEIIAFTTGFSLMAFELVAARVLAPSIGSSTYVWTSVIGVIIAALSVGYWTGGRLADVRHRRTDIVVLCLLAAIGVVAMASMYEVYLDWTASTFTDSRIQALMASLVLFAPTSLVLGMISPYLVKLKVTSLASSGQSVASLSALNSIGGIVGTFITGFVLFGYIGSRETLVVVVVLLIVSSWLLVPRQFLWWRIGLSVILLFVIALPVGQTEDGVGIDTPSAHYEVVTGISNNRQITGLTTGPGGIQSAIYADGSPDLVFWYTQEIARIIKERSPDSLLMLGGGAFTLPQYLSEVSPTMKIDAIEIDPQLETIAKQYFSYRSSSNVSLSFDDARAFLNKTDKKYDLIIVDVYGDNSIPFQLTTTEYGEEVARHLTPDGIVVANVIAGEAAPSCKRLLAAVNGAYASYLPYILYSTQSGYPERRSNYIVVYSKQKLAISQMYVPKSLGADVYTDNYAPAERLHYDCVRNA